MRSVFVHFREATEAEVTEYLSQIYTPVGEQQWTVFDRKDAPLLYVAFYRDMNTEFETEDYFILLEKLGGEPCLSIVANVSGAGEEEVRKFACDLLGRWNGLAQDDHGDYFWTREDILCERINGHKFFGNITRTRE